MGRSYYDDVLDVAIRHAGHDILKEKTAQSFSGETHFSQEFERKMKSIISAEKRKRSTSKTLRVASKAAAALLVLVVVSTMVIFSSEALRVKVMNMFYSIGGDSAEVQFYDDNNIPEGMIMPEYIPEGYRLTKAEKVGSMYNSEYQNSDGNTIYISEQNEGANPTLDKDVAAYPTEIKGRPGFVCINDNQMNIVVFNYASHDFIISGKIDVSELTKIAESMIK